MTMNVAIDFTDQIEYFGDIPPVCPYCKAKAEFVNSDTIYTNGKRYGMMWVCGNNPLCDARVGVHKGTNIPYGRMADKQLRNLKQVVHQYLDPLWEEVGYSRSEVYFELSKRMGIPREYCHIGMFNKDACHHALDILKNWNKDFFLHDKVYLGKDRNSGMKIYLEYRHRVIPEFVKTSDGFFTLNKSNMQHVLHYKAGHKPRWTYLSPNNSLDSLVELAEKNVRRDYRIS